MTREREVSAGKSVVKLFRGIHGTARYSRGGIVKLFGSLVGGIITPRFELQQSRSNSDLFGCVNTLAVGKVPARHAEMTLGFVD